MKPFVRFINLIITAVLLCSFVPQKAYSQYREAALQADSIEISLLTCGPRQQVYSLYGHTAIRFQDKQHGRDLAINYGVFSFDKPFFVLRFVFGLTDYEIGIVPFDTFCWEYESSGCGVRQQVLNISVQEKIAIAEAIDRNYEPQNRVYRYNFFYDNCTTRARDILLDNVNGSIVYNDSSKVYPSYRELIHQYNENNRWARFGNDLLLGVKADFSTDFAEQQFLPGRLCNDVEQAYIKNNDGTKRKLVSRSFWVLAPTNKQKPNADWFTPTLVLGTVALLILIVAAIERRRKRMLWAFDAFVMLATGLCGLVLLAMVFSQHPTVSLNLQILLLNPLNIVMLYGVTKAARQNRVHWWTKVWSILILLFLFGGFIQSYAEGMTFMALSLLIRNISNIKK